MIVRLTHTHWNGIRSRGPEHVVEWMAEHRTPIGKQHDYIMPAIGWRQLLDEMVRTAYGPLGGKVQRTPESVYTAIRRIADKVAAMEAHPALIPARAVYGYAPDVIPAFRHDDGWSPYPSSGEFVILRPKHFEYRGHKLTMWEPGSPDPEDVTHEVAHHTHFIR